MVGPLLILRPIHNFVEIPRIIEKLILQNCVDFRIHVNFWVKLNGRPLIFEQTFLHFRGRLVHHTLASWNVQRKINSFLKFWLYHPVIIVRQWIFSFLQITGRIVLDYLLDRMPKVHLILVQEEIVHFILNSKLA